MPCGLERKSRDQWDGLQKERLLDGARILRLTFHKLPLHPLAAKQARVFDRHGDVSGQRLKDLQLILGEGVDLLVIDR